MALFTKKATAKAEPKKEKAEMSVVATNETTTKVSKSRGIDLTMVIIRPHVTEKATDLSEKNVYAFEVHKLANKAQVIQAVERLYKVTPLKVAIVNIPPKYMRSPKSGRTQVKKHGQKKALVYLKKGDKIELV